MRRWLWMGIGLVTMAGRAMAAPVGMASHIEGKPEVSAGGAWKPLELLQRLDAGAKVRCGAGAEAVIVLFGNGNRYQIGAGKTGTLQEANVAGAQSLGGMGGPSTRVAKALGGSRAGAFMARPAPQQHQTMTIDTPGWLLEGEKHLQWTPIPGAASYSFSLFDQNDDVLWNTRVTDAAADYPADAPTLNTHKPYLWRVTPLGQNGKPLLSAAANWGFLTFLSQEDADQLKEADATTANAAALNSAVQKNKKDLTPLVMLAELYRQYGVIEKTLTIYEVLRDSGETAAGDAVDKAYQGLGAYAYTLGHPHPPTDATANGNDK